MECELMSMLDRAIELPRLMEASERGHLGVVQALLKWGADVNAQNVSGRTALMEASCKGHP